MKGFGGLPYILLLQIYVQTIAWLKTRVEMKYLIKAYSRTNIFFQAESLGKST